MPFTSAELSDLGKVSLDTYMKNKPFDQIDQERPLLRKLVSMQSEFTGGKEYVVEQLRYRYGSNFQWYFGQTQVSYNLRKTIEQARFPWRGWHDGFFFDEDTLAANAIIVTDDAKPRSASQAEMIQLTNLFTEANEVLRLGAEEKWDYELHRDGTQSGDALAGLEHLIALDPTASATPGGINQQTNLWWRNHASLGISGANLRATMETYWRNAVRHGGRPDYLLFGETAVDTYRDQWWGKGTIQVEPGGTRKADFGVGMRTQGVDTGMDFKGVPIYWSPTFSDLDDDLSPATPWKKRMYFFNCRTIKLRPMQGHNMITRKPPRHYSRYVHYWGLTWKGAFTTNRRNANVVLSVA